MVDVDPFALLEHFRALKPTLLEHFRALIFTALLEHIRALKRTPSPKPDFHFVLYCMACQNPATTYGHFMGVSLTFQVLLRPYWIILGP